MIHIEGMGLLGALLGYHLHHQGIPFTWHDIDAPHVAWKASTGLVYPAGDDRSTRDLAAWGQWHTAGFLPAGMVEQVTYCYAHKHPPHKGRYTVTQYGTINAANAEAYVVNVAAIVRTARAQFDHQRRTTPAPDRTALIRAHGHRRATRWVWGWSTLVRLATPPELADLSHRPSFYGRRVRRPMYAYPLAGHPGWYRAGSTLIGQTTPRALDGDIHYALWERNWPALFPQAPVLERGSTFQGWRPRPSDNDDTNVQVDGRTLTFPALWHSGVRWAPSVIADTMHTLHRIGVA